MRILPAVVLSLACAQVVFGAELVKFHRLEENFDHDRNNRLFEGLFNRTLECIREILKVGLPDLNIPSFDPLRIDELDLDLGIFHISGLSGVVGIKESVLQGFTKWEIFTLRGDIGLLPPSYTVTLAINFPNITYSTGYLLNVTYKDNNLYGNGSLYVEAVDLSFEVALKAILFGGITLDHFRASPSLAGLNAFVITGLGDNNFSAELSGHILENASDIVDQNSDLIGSIISGLILDAINSHGGGADGGSLHTIVQKCLFGQK